MRALRVTYPYAACFRNKKPELALFHGTLPSLGHVCMCACGHAETMHRLWIFETWASLCSSVKGKKKEKKSGWYPIFLTIPGCVYIKSTLAVSGYGKTSIWMFTHTRGCERGNRLESDLCLEKSQTSSSTLQLTHSVMTIHIHNLMSKVLPPLTTGTVWSVAVCKEHRFWLK